jgi:plasmid stabilization system protein ParE
VTFAILVARIADHEIGMHYIRIAERSLPAAERWRTGVWAVIRSLATLPERFPEAPEAEWYGPGLRETYYGKRLNTYRILYEVRGQAVYIHRVRHGRQDLLQPGEM